MEARALAVEGAGTVEREDVEMDVEGRPAPWMRVNSAVSFWPSADPPGSRGGVPRSSTSRAATRSGTAASAVIAGETCRNFLQSLPTFPAESSNRLNR